MGLEKMGLPPKPWEKGKDWTPDAPLCEGCQGAFTWINRKHHCRRCGGLFCNNCTMGRVYLRGQGDAPARVCDPCKQYEEAARFERYSKSKAPRGGAKASKSKDDVEDTLKHILKPEGKPGGDDVDVESILASVAAESDGDDHDLEEHAPVSPTRLHEEAQEEKKRYTALKKQGKDAEALKAFKRAKELERQAEAIEKEIRHQQRRAASSTTAKTSPPSKEETQNQQKKRRTPSQDLGKEKGEKDDFLQDLKALGWSDKEIREAEKKPVVLSEEQLLRELAAEVRAKSEKAATSSAAPAPGPTDAISTQITAHKRQALALKREGKLAEAKEELRKAKILEKQAEEMALLGGEEDEASDDDEIQALIRKLEREEKMKAGKGAGKGPAASEDLGFDISFVGDDEDAHVEVDDDDLDDPEMAAALLAMGWEEDAAAAAASKPQPKASKPAGPTLKEQILARKKKALALKREGKIAEARAELAEAKKLEQQLENPSTPPPVAKAPEPVEGKAEVADEEGKAEVADEEAKADVADEEEKVEVTDEDMRDPEMMAALRAMGFGDDEPAAHEAVAAAKPKAAAVDEFSLKQEILGIKRQALALKREGRVDEARDTLRRAKGLEQQLDDLQAVSQRQEETPAVIKESRELRRVAQALPTLNFGDDDGEEEDVEVENADLVDPEIAAALAAMGWQEDLSEKPVAVPQSKETPANSVVQTMKVAAKEPEPAPVAVVSTKTKSLLQQELLGRKRRALALKREGKSEEARIELQEAKLIEQQIADLDATPPTVAEAKPVAAQPPPKLSKQEPEPSRPVYLDDLPVDEVEVTEDDMQDPSLRAALAGMGWQEVNEEVAAPTKPAPSSEKSSKEPQAQTGEKVKNLLEFDWGDPQWHAKKTGKKEQDVKSPQKDEEENPFEGEYGEIGQTMDIVPPLSGNNAAPSQQRSPWSIFDRFQSKEETSPNKESEAKKLPPFPKPPERPPPVAAATDVTVNAQPATPNLQQEILALKRKALALKREGKAAEAREELRKAKLLERQQGAQPVVSSTSTTTAAGKPSVKVKEVVVVAPPPVPVKTSPQAATKSPGHKEEMQKQVRQTKDRMKLQQESLAHKRKAMNLRREGQADEADAEYELAKALEKQMEDLDPMHGKQEEDLGDVAGVDELLDPQLMAALKGLGFGEGELSRATTSTRPSPPSVKGSSSRSSSSANNVEAEKKQLEEQIRAQKMQAVQLKRAGKQAEALDKLRGAKQLEKRLLSLTSS